MYTHPFWMFLLSAIYFCTHQIYFTALFLSLTISFAAITIMALYLAKSPGIAALAVVTLAASKTFVDYSTSGLENPLTHLLIVLFILIYFNAQQRNRSLFWLALIAALAAFNRLDTLLLTAPALIYMLYRSPRLASVKAILLGFLPLLLWEAFSLWYYGFLFPNTAYAKLHTGISSIVLLHQGIGYFISSCKFDPLLFIVIASAFAMTLVSREWRNLPFLIGITLNMLYLLKIGGDFMAGRFLTASFLIAVILLAHSSYSLRAWLWVPVLAIVVLFGFLTPNSRWYPIFTNNVLVDGRGVADEHNAYVDATGIINLLRGTQIPDSPWARAGIKARLSGQSVIVEPYSIGFFAFEAGPNIHIIDLPALSDPLLARLPTTTIWQWRIGHFYRKMPDGYFETLQSGTNHIQNRNLALYYDKLRYITRGSLFDIQRLIEIWKFNTGAYDYLLKAYTNGPAKTGNMHSEPDIVQQEWDYAIGGSALTEAQMANTRRKHNVVLALA